MSRWLTGLLGPAVAIALTGCGGGGGGSIPTVPSPAPVGPDVVVSLASTRTELLPNQENRFTVTVRNGGVAAASSTTLTVPAVAGLTYEAAVCTASEGAMCPSTVTAHALAGGLGLPSIPVGGLLSFVLDGVTTGAAGTLVIPSATAVQVGDLVPGSNSAQREINIAAPAKATLVSSVPPPTYPEGSELREIYNWLNAERSRCGMGLLRQDERVDLAADDHSKYMAVNIDNGNLTGIVHEQDPTFPGFTGVSGTARVQFRGYPGTAGDLVAYSDAASSGIKSLFGYATYHSLIAQAGFGLRDVGLGTARSIKTNWALSVLNMASPTVSPEPSETTPQLAGDAVATYPCGGEVLLWRNHIAETPSPFPNTDMTTKGPPITVFVRVPQRLLIRDFLLSTESGVSLPGTLLTSAERPGLIATFQAAFIPDAPLPADTTFNVYIRGTNEGQRFEKRFSFSTGN